MHIKAYVFVSSTILGLVAVSAPTRPPCVAVLASPAPKTKCGLKGALTNVQDSLYWGFSDNSSTNAQNSARCAIECRRDPRCKSWSYNRADAQQCSLYERNPRQLGFVAKKKSKREINYVECYNLDGDCLPANGGFEDPVVDLNGEGPVYHPWVNEGFIVRNNSDPGPFAPTPEGSSFNSVVGLQGRDTVRASQIISLQPQKTYLYNISINFQYTRTSGNNDPDGYLVTSTLCGETIDLWQRNPLGSDNTWKANGGSVVTTPQQCNNVDNQILEISFGAIPIGGDGSQFMSNFAFDDVSFDFCGGPRSLCEQFYPSKKT